MGQRHQTFIIARVGSGSTRRYRCVAAFHWQWLYGQGPARSATRFIRAVKNTTNSLLIKADLDTFDTYGQEYTNLRSNDWDRFVPCPYISTLYQAATCVGVDDAYYNGCSMLDANMRSDGGDNNDGITIFDVTEPQNPRYCMVSISGLEASGKKTKRRRPMSARTYVEAYYPFINPSSYEGPPPPIAPEELEAIRSAYKGLEGIPIIDSATLAEAFPGEYDPRAKEWGKSESDSEDKAQTNVANSVLVPLEDSVYTSSLVSITARKVVHTLITQPTQSYDDIQLLPQLVLDASAMEILLTDIATHPTLPDSILPFLAKLLLQKSHNRGFVDLSPFALQMGQTTALAGLLPSCSILKLGGRNVSDVEVVSSLIRTLPLLKILILFGSEISIDDTETLYSIGRPGQLEIAHKLTYFSNLRNKDDILRSRYADLEFAFLLKAHRTTYYRNDRGKMQEAGGYVKLEDPNFIIRSLCDALSTLSGDTRYEQRLALPQICFGVDDRPYEALFAPSTLVNLAPEPKLPSHCTKWMFVFYSPKGYSLTYSWMYGFVRCNSGVAEKVLDLDEFIETIHAEYPELPLVAGFEELKTLCRAPEEYSTFYETLRWILGTSKEKTIIKPSTLGRNLVKSQCQLITLDKATEVMADFAGDKTKSEGID